MIRKMAFHSFRVGKNNPVIADNIYEVAEYSIVWGAEVINLKNYICL